MAARKKKRELSEKAQKRIRQRNLHVGITVIAAIVIIFSVIQFTLWRYVSKVDEEYICKNVFIGKTDVSGMTKEEAVKAVDNTLGDYRNKQLVLKVKDQGADVSIEEMGAEVENIDKLAEKAVGYGKNGSIWSRYQKIHNLDKKKYVIDESFKVDEAKLRELIQERAVPLEQKAVNASASYNGSGFDLTDEAEGYTVDVDKSVKKIKNFMNKKWNYEDAEVELKLDMEKPTIKKAIWNPCRMSLALIRQTPDGGPRAEHQASNGADQRNCCYAGRRIFSGTGHTSLDIREWLCGRKCL